MNNVLNRSWRSSAPLRSNFEYEISHEQGIDGLRGYGVVMVALFHSGVFVDDAGAYAIGAFFTISGFVIGHLVIREWNRTSGFDVARFVSSRLIRLYPTLTLTCIVVFGWVGWVGPRSGRVIAQQSTWASLVHYYNLFILRSSPDTYDRLFTARSPWAHIWSVSIEEQFYLVFAVAVAVCVRRYGKGLNPVIATRWLFAAVGALTVWQVGSVIVGMADTRVAYLRTDSRSAEFVVGVLAAVLHSRGFLRRLSSTKVSIYGFAALATVTLSWYFIPRDKPQAYWGGLQVHAILIACLTICACTPSTFRRVLSSALLVRLGRWSYAIYLFHWPAIIFFQYWRRDTSTAVALQAVALSICAAGLVTEWFEKPIRRWASTRRRHAVALLAASAACLASAAGCAGSRWQYSQKIGARNDAAKAAIAEPPPNDPRAHVIWLSDSVGNGILGSASRFDTDRVWVNRVQSGCVLTSDETWWIGGWQARSKGTCPGIVDRVANEAREIDTVVFAFGNGDSREHRRGGEVYSVESKDGRVKVGAEIESYLKTLSRNGSRLVVLTIGPSLSYDATAVEAVTPSQARAWNRVLTGVVRQEFPDIEVVHMEDLLADDYRPVEKRNGCVLRGTDGFHLSQCGADLAAKLVLKTLDQPS